MSAGRRAGGYGRGVVKRPETDNAQAMVTSVPSGVSGYIVSAFGVGHLDAAEALGEAVAGPG